MAEYCTITGTLYTGNGADDQTVAVGRRLRITPISVAGLAVLSSSFRTEPSDEDGVISFTLLAGGRFKISGSVIGFTGEGTEVTIPSEDEATLESLIADSSYTLNGLTIKEGGVALSGLFTTLNFVNLDVEGSAGIATITYSGVGGGNQSANSVYAGPASGLAAPASFRSLVAADMPSSIDAAKIGGGLVSNAEFAFLDGAASNLQTQITARLTQAQADALYSALAHNHSGVYEPVFGFTAENVANKATGFGTLNNTLYPSVQAVASYAQPLSTNLTTFASIAPSANVQTLLASASFSAFRDSLGVEIGSDVQAFSTHLSSVAAIGSALQQLRVNAGGTALEYFTPSAGDVLANSTRTLNHLTKWTDASGKEIGNSLITDNGTNIIAGLASGSGAFIIGGASSPNPGLRQGSTTIGKAVFEVLGYDNSGTLLDWGLIKASHFYGGSGDVLWTAADTTYGWKALNSGQTAFVPVAVSKVILFGSGTSAESHVFTGSGSPEGVVTAGIGSIYLRHTDGGAGSTFWVKESGSGSSGWVAK